jgi:hypothetical protein
MVSKEIVLIVDVCLLPRNGQLFIHEFFKFIGIELSDISQQILIDTFVPGASTVFTSLVIKLEFHVSFESNGILVQNQFGLLVLFVLQVRYFDHFVEVLRVLEYHRLCLLSLF